MARGQIEFEGANRAEVEHTNDGLAAMGLQLVDDLEAQQDEYWLWPENDEAFGFWLSVQTQWNASMGGATGLNYPGVETCLRLRGLKKKARQHLFLLTQMMERACLEEWAQQRKA